MNNNKQNKKVLLVDDDRVILKLYNDFFAAKEGYDLITASDRDEGLKKAIEENPDLIVLDLVLPKNLQVPVEEEEMNKEFGFKLLERLKKEEKTRHLPIIVFSNLVGDQDEKRAYDLGAVKFVEKTTSLPGELLDVIEKVLNK